MVLLLVSKSYIFFVHIVSTRENWSNLVKFCLLFWNIAFFSTKIFLLKIIFNFVRVHIFSKYGSAKYGKAGRCRRKSDGPIKF